MKLVSLIQFVIPAGLLFLVLTFPESQIAIVSTLALICYFALHIHQVYAEKDSTGRNIWIIAINGLTLAIAGVSLMGVIFTALFYLNITGETLLTVSINLVLALYLFDTIRDRRNLKTFLFFQRRPLLTMPGMLSGR